MGGHYEISGVGYHTLSTSPAISPQGPRWAIMRFQALNITFTLCHQISLGPVCALITYEYSFSILSKNQQSGGDSVQTRHHGTKSSLIIDTYSCLSTKFMKYYWSRRAAAVYEVYDPTICLFSMRSDCILISAW